MNPTFYILGLCPIDVRKEVGVRCVSTIGVRAEEVLLRGRESEELEATSQNKEIQMEVSPRWQGLEG